MASPGASPRGNSAIKKDASNKRNLSVGFGKGNELHLNSGITSGGLAVIKDSNCPYEDESPTKITDLKSLRASPMFD